MDACRRQWKGGKGAAAAAGNSRVRAAALRTMAAVLVRPIPAEADPGT